MGEKRNHINFVECNLSILQLREFGLDV